MSKVLAKVCSPATKSLLLYNSDICTLLEAWLESASALIPFGACPPTPKNLGSILYQLNKPLP